MGCPSASCHDCCPMTSSRREEPCPKPEVTFWSLTDVEGAWNFFPQRRKSDFLKWENCALWAEFLGSAFCGKGEGQHSQDLGPVGTVTCLELQTLLCCPRWKQEKAEARTARWSLENSPLGRPRKKNVTEKVERLRDNQRSLSVAIYNRDYKVVN